MSLRVPFLLLLIALGSFAGVAAPYPAAAFSPTAVAAPSTIVAAID